MKRLTITLLILAVFSGTGLAQDKKAKPQDQKVKESYSIGYQMASELKKQKIEIDPEAFSKGARDAVAGKEPMLPMTEMRTVLMTIQQRASEAMRLQREEAAKTNLTDGERFLSQNSKKEGVVTLPSGLQYRILKKGDGATPKASDSVTVHYKGALIDGTEFDSSFSRNQPATFKVDGVIPGWKEALQLMPAGSKWEICVPPSLAYGDRGAGRNIGPNSTLIFEVELISVN